MKKKKKSGGMLKKTAVFSILMAVIAMLICGLVLFVLFRNRAMKNVNEKLEKMAGAVSYDIFKYASSEWLLEYWRNNYDKMTMPPEDYNEFLEWRASLEEFMRLNAEAVQTREVEAMTEEEQKQFAEFCYYKISVELGGEPQMLGLDRVTVFFPEEENKEAFLFYLMTTPDAEEWGNRYILGTRIPFDPALHPEMEKTLRENYVISDVETYRSERDGKEYASCYFNISFEGKLYGVVSVTTSLEQVLKDVWADVFRFEGWIALVILIAITVDLLNIYFGTIRPTLALQREIRSYTQTWDSKTLSEKLAENRPSNELGQLADDLVLMGKEIDLYLTRIQKVTAEKERISAELDVASKIQTGVLPKPFSDPADEAGCVVYASMKPAKEVGGDLYDFYYVDKDHLALIIGDVSDKGIPAALFMVTVKALIKSAIKRGGMSPKEVLSAVSDQMSEGNEECMFVTVWLGILELSTGKMICSNAGHEFPVIYRKNEAFSYFRDMHGIPVATMEGAEYEDYELVFRPGDTLFIYSDGLPEAQNTAGEQFGEERLLEVLNEDPGDEPKELIERMTKQVAQFVGDRDPFDDLTMLCVKLRASEDL
ncbi:MAG: serine/threonine-protein phosphatase [Lachnospiraceae bacterium]|nr:serine/threonine-protein phosphatase [Lachnospiraceae bacterium]